MSVSNKVFIATSIDGYIADKEGGIDWLNSIPNPDHEDMGYGDFMHTVDAIVMGRVTYETVLGFDMEWPFDKPVFVLSNSLKVLPEKLNGKVQLMQGRLTTILSEINSKGYNKLYIDGGKTVQGFLQEDLIDEMIITLIPCLLGGGTPLFAETTDKLDFACSSSKLFLDAVVQNHFVRQR